MVADLLDQLLANTYTQTEALSRLRALRDLILVQLFGSKTKSTRAERPPSPDGMGPTGQQTLWLTSLDKDFYSQFNRKNVYGLFDSLEREIKKNKPLVIYLPFELPEESVTDLGQRLRKNFGKNFLAEIKIDPLLIAGCSLVWNGIYKDYSIRQKITDNRERILAMIGEYIKK